MSFESRTVQKGDVELRIRIILTRNASQLRSGESVNLVGVLLLHPVCISVLPGELVAPSNECRSRIARVVRGPEFSAAGFIGDIDQHLGIVAQGHIARKRCGLPFHKGSNGLGIDPELQTVALRGGFVAVQPEFRGFMAIEEVLQLAQPENVVARRIFRQAAFHEICRKVACRLRRSFGGRDEIVLLQPFDDALQGIAGEIFKRKRETIPAVHQADGRQPVLTKFEGDYIATKAVVFDCKRRLIILLVGEAVRICQPLAVYRIGLIGSHAPLPAGDDRADHTDLISAQFFECFFVFHSHRESSYL